MEMEQMMERLLAKIDTRMDAIQKQCKNLKELKEDIKTNQAKTDINLKEMREEIQSGQASNQNVQRVTEKEELELVEGSAPSGAENQGLDTVEGSTPSKTEEKTY
jgi:F0F1-type ATP synthase membrane subunit b/b'